MALPAWNCVFNTRCDEPTGTCSQTSSLLKTFGMKKSSSKSPPSKVKLSLAGNPLARGHENKHCCKNESHKNLGFLDIFPQQILWYISSMTYQWLFRKLPMCTLRMHFWLLRLWDDEEVPTIGAHLAAGHGLPPKKYACHSCIVSPPIFRGVETINNLIGGMSPTQGWFSEMDSKCQAYQVDFDTNRACKLSHLRLTG